MDSRNFGIKYPACRHIIHPKAEITVNKEIITRLTHEAEILPLYEEKLYQLKHKKNYSLFNNALLKCRWYEFVKSREGLKKTPFQFPCVNDFHFCKYTIRYDQSETTCNKINNRKRMKNGPGVDNYGQMPIPDDMHLRKTVGPGSAGSASNHDKVNKDE